MQDETTLTSRVNTREIIQILSARKYIHLAAANSEASTELNQGLWSCPLQDQSYRKPAYGKSFRL